MMHPQVQDTRSGPAIRRPLHGGYPEVAGPQRPARAPAAGSADTALADVIAYLEQRRDNADTMAARQPQFCEWAADRRRQLDAMLDDLRAGLHVGKAEVRAHILGTAA
jgi:hypothetical protein